MSKTKEKEPKAKSTWEIKDRNYFLTGDKEPLTYTLKSRHTEKYPLLYFDTESNTQRALRYATNQNSPFVDEQKGEVTLKHIMFKDGSLFVPKEQQALQKLLSLYHPDLNGRYAELKPQAIAEDELVDLQLEIMAKDENVILRNFGIKAAEAGIIEVSQDQRTFTYGSNKRKLFTIPFDENPYSALAAWFKTDEGVEVYKTIEKKIS